MLHGKMENLWIGIQLVVDELRDSTFRNILPIFLVFKKMVDKISDARA